MPARSGLSALILLVLGACSSPERHDSPGPTTVSACEASNTCGSGGSGSLPPINDPTMVAGPCSSGKCTGSEAGTYDGTVGPVEDAQSEATLPSDARVIDGSEASRPNDGGLPNDGGPG